MNLLLLLSALLSAVSVGAPAMQMPVAVNQVAAAVQPARVAAAIVPGRPKVVMPTLVDARALLTAPAWRLAAPAPLYLSRRRE